MNVSFSTRGWQQIPWEQQVLSLIHISEPTRPY